MTDDAKFLEFPPESFPFEMTVFSMTDPDGLMPLYNVLVTGPGAVSIPPLRKPGSPANWIRVQWPDGRIQDVGKDARGLEG